MKVLFATAELAPLARVGGLAEAAAGLVRELRSTGNSVDIVLPDYGDGYVAFSLADETISELAVPHWAGPMTVRRGIHPEVGPVTLLGNPSLTRDHPYVDANGEGWPDNDHRFFSFSAGVAALALAEAPDVVHLNDWHTAAAIGFLNAAPARPPTVLTIHTLGYQGIADRGWLEVFGPDAHRFAWHDATNPVAGAIELVDKVITVSPNYATEILTPAEGMGLHDRLAGIGPKLVGIRNGIDATRWDPSIDLSIAAPFSKPDDDGRAQAREALMTEAGWTASPQGDAVPIAAVVTRLVDQKGVDLILDAARFLPNLPLRLAVLGSGSAELAGRLRSVANANPDWVWFYEGFDEALAHRLFAGSDLFLMPSRFEPCGLAQMQAMAYGSIPVVTDVGGLHDTVIDADGERTEGTGFVSATVDTAGLVDAMHRATRAVRHPARRRAIQRRGMAVDWSWAAPAANHVEIYKELLSA